LKKYLPILVLALFILAGCAITMPTMPDVETQRGRDCVRECQRDLSSCVSSPQDIPEHSLTRNIPEQSSDSNILTQDSDESIFDKDPTSGCNSELYGCYQRCLEMEKGSFGCKLLIPGTPNPFTIGQSLFDSN